ncbi:D-alanyl-lipoteichoic acid acyltransferase DltB, MBOAT superfamily [Oribacterium sp. KHPX15]|uniref:MBOAT family O-acyltransferase n=1 Tax=Oribacterium sp. KHPX15 TaxID=1855342 RepID=UPI000895771D|nr:MBOAT family protein [Oribacterium sp. KHPX15]SEA34679.1 D-alanyl-lipoteichoic acid acyltransferase DltB, MBOAT superfamily [Oribacterium sp. KHPX15]
MVFSSTLFLFGFLPLTLAGYYLCLFLDKKIFKDRKIFGNYWLLFMSLIFFAWSQIGYVWIIAASILINYTGALLIYSGREKNSLPDSAVQVRNANGLTAEDSAVQVRNANGLTAEDSAVQVRNPNGLMAEDSAGQVRNPNGLTAEDSAVHAQNHPNGLTVNKRPEKLFLFLTVAANLLLLFYFKYFDFTIATINQIFKTGFSLRNIVLPIGISFFTFQAMSYTIDVYRNKAGVQKNPFKLALYVMLFPQLIAGPIVRYTDVEAEIDERSVSLDDFSDGARRFVIGLSKKALIANTMAVTVDSIWGQGIENNTVAIAWLGAIAYGLQIYFDFSGYSDMAIGLGRMFGFHFLENFDLPYISRSITEFWRRWHISLSSWFRDYVYIPLGGNRKGTLNTYRNLFIVFLLTGIWHGAAWNYIFWGLWHGMFMLVERAFRKPGGSTAGHVNVSVMDTGSRGRSGPEVSQMSKENDVFENIKVLIRHVYTLLVVLIGWVFFRAGSLSEGLWYLKTMLGRALGQTPGYSVMWYLDGWTAFILVAGIALSLNIPGFLLRKTGVETDRILNIKVKKCEEREVQGKTEVKSEVESEVESAVESEVESEVKSEVESEVKSEGNPAVWTFARDIALILLLLLSVMRIVSGTYNPFIYFQF